MAPQEAAFADNSIYADILPDLSDSDLKELGLTLGDRKRLLKAIANLGAALTLPQPAGPPTALPQSDAAERRQLTVMFCDLVNSTGLTARLDPEDTRDVVRAYQDACSGAIARYDGFVAKFMGDGVLAYFGFPRAHEDDAERAVRAGLDVAAVVPNLDTRAKEKSEGPHRYRDRHRRRRRIGRTRVGSGTGRRGRDPQSGGTLASTG